MAPPLTRAGRGDQINGETSTAEDSKPIMETNGSSIVSKRSVEHAYYQPPHFLRYFVKKRKTRAPLINRGYWLRMQCIEKTILDFCRKSHGSSLVINLGAGYDALPFRLLSQDTETFQNTLFLDVDYPELIGTKVKMILAEPELCKPIGKIYELSTDDARKLISEKYWAIACDLHDFQPLKQILAGFFADGKDQRILLISEVATCYMKPSKVNEVWSWFSDFDDVTLCLLEQHLPNGSSHPFAETMLKHFHKLRSPLQGIEKYSTMHHQMERLEQLGWKKVQIESLWQFWCNRLSSSERDQLDSKEPFDEWEEFALYACHYFLLIAKTDEKFTPTEFSLCSPAPGPSLPESAWVRSRNGNPTNHSPLLSRRFGALYHSSNNCLHLHGGYEGSRKASTITCYLAEDRVLDSFSAPSGIEPRLCHTVTKFNKQFDTLLVGGRASPDRVLSDCWVRSSGSWRQTESLPVPLFRHCATAVSINDSLQGVLVYGGRTAHNLVSSECFLWYMNVHMQHEETGKEKEKIGQWVRVPIHCSSPPLGRFAASMASFDGTSEGLLLGGLLQSGVPARECFAWYLVQKNKEWIVRFEILGSSDFTEESSLCELHRFGATLIHHDDGFVLIGGVGSDALVAQDQQALFITKDQGKHSLRNLKITGLDSLLIGHTATSTGSTIYVVGGGATCFSFGSFNNGLPLKITEGGTVSHSNFQSVEHAANETQEALPESSISGKILRDLPNNTSPSTANTPKMENIEVLSNVTEHQFTRSLNELQPVVLKDLDFGPCTTKWTHEHLKKAIGFDRRVSIHRSHEDYMTFQPGSKNFTYVECAFGDFMTSISHGGKEYFRALSNNDTSTPANLSNDFPELSGDFCLPQALSTVRERMHSSVLRISGSISMWLHYDVLANILVQIQGRKTLVLFPPSDVSFFEIPAGSSSSRIKVSDLLHDQSPYLRQTHPLRVTLNPGEALFIPPLWLHCATPNDTVSVAVNVFFRNMDDGYAAGRDAYGNRDVQAYEEGRRDIAKTINRLRRLPQAMADFYLQRLKQEFQEQNLHTSGTQSSE